MKSREISELGMLLSIAFVLSYLESRIPIIIAVPGMKIGLANIATMFVLYRYNFWKAFLFMTIRVFLTGLLFAGVSTIPFSLAGGMVCIIVMSLLKKRSSVSILGVSMIGAIGHNVGQIIVACIITENIHVARYFSILCLSGAISGFLIGYVSFCFLKKYNKLFPKDHK